MAQWLSVALSIKRTLVRILAAVSNLAQFRSLYIVPVHSGVCTNTGHGSGGYVSTNNFGALIAAWLDASYRRRDGV